MSVWKVLSSGPSHKFLMNSPVKVRVVEVDFAPPKDYREPAPVASTINAPPAEEEEDEEEEVDPFTGEGRRSVLLLAKKQTNQLIF